MAAFLIPQKNITQKLHKELHIDRVMLIFYWLFLVQIIALIYMKLLWKFQLKSVIRSKVMRDGSWKN